MTHYEGLRGLLFPMICLNFITKIRENIFVITFCEKNTIQKMHFFRKRFDKNKIFSILSSLRRFFGEMAEWSNATVLKTVSPQGLQGSNPCLSATTIKTTS